MLFIGITKALTPDLPTPGIFTKLIQIDPAISLFSGSEFTVRPGGYGKGTASPLLPGLTPDMVGDVAPDASLEVAHPLHLLKPMGSLQEVDGHAVDDVLPLDVSYATLGELSLGHLH